MAELVMDNPFSGSAQGSYAKTIHDLQDCITKLKEDFEDSRMPLTDDNQDLQRLFVKLEYLLQSGIKAKSSLLGGKKDYWNFICDSVSSNKSLNDGIRFVKANSEVKTNLGRGRSLIRFALMHHRLADTLQHCVYNTTVTKDWYQPKAVWFQQQPTSEIINALYDLNDLQFDLESRGYDLDTSWPTFARKQFLGTGAWQAPSRTISIGSLNSTSQDIAQSLDANSQTQLLEQAENEKLAAETKTEELQSELAKVEKTHSELIEENKTLKDKVLELQLNANERLRATSEFEVMCGKLANELALKEETWGEKEKLFQMRLDESKKAMERQTQAQQQDLSASAASAVDLVEMKSKLTSAEKTNKSMKIDLTCLEKEINAKTKVDTVKNQLIDMQERKIGKQTDEVKRLQTRLESLLVDKQADVNMVESLTQRIENLTTQFSKSQAAYESVMKKNAELTQMLHSVEEKGSNIGKVAKEKLTQYKKDNEELKEKLASLEQSNKSKEDDIDGAQSKLGELTHEREQLAEQLKQLQTKLDQKDATFQSNQTALVQNTEEISNLKAVIDNLQSNSSSKDTELTQELIKTKEENAKLKANLENSAATAEKLEQMLEEKTCAWNTEKEKLLNDIAIKSNESQEINTKLAEKMKVLESCEKQMESEKAILVQQMEGQGTEIEQLKLELTGLSKLLEQAGFNEIAEDRKACVRSLIESKNTLEKSVTSMHASQSQLLSQLENSTEKISTASDEIKTIGEEKTMLQTLVNTLEKTIESLQQKYNAKSIEFDQLVNTFSNLENEISVFESRIAEHNSIVTTLNETIADKDKILQAKDKKYDSCVEKLSILQLSLQEMENNRDSLQKQLNAKSYQLEALDSKLKDATNAVGLLESRKLHLEKVNLENDEKLTTLMKEVESKNVYISQKETDVKQTSDNFDSVQKQLESTETYKKLLEEKIRTVSEKCESLEKEKQSANDTYTVKLQDLEGKLIEASAQNLSVAQANSKCETKIKELESEVQQLTEYKTKLTTKIDALENTCDNYIKQNECYKTENAELSTKLSKLESINAEIVIQSDQLQSERTELSSRLEETNKLQSEILSQMDETNAQIMQFNEDLSEKNGQILLLEKQKAAVSTDFENIQTLVAQLQQEVASLEKQKTEQAEESNKSFFKLKDKLGSVECENEQLREEIQNTIANKDQLFTQMTEQDNESKSEINALKEQLQIQTEQCSELESKNKSLLQEIETFQVSIQEKDVYISQADREKAEVEEKMERWKESLEGKEKESADQLENLEKTIEELKECVQQKVSEIEMLQSTHEQEVKCIQFQLSTEQMQHQSAVQEYESKERDYNSMQDKITSLEEQVETFEFDTEKSKNLIQETNNQHRQLISGLQEKLTEKDNEFQMLTQELVKKSQAFDKEFEENHCIKKKLAEKENESDKVVDKMTSQIDSLKDENEQIKKKLIQLIKEKDALWKKSDKLAFKQKMRLQVWAESDNILNCTECKAAFGFMLRKHHCRLCGQIYCHYCCNNWVMTSFSNKKERVCGACLMEQSHLESASEGEDSDTTADSISRDDVEDTIEIPTMRSPKWKDRDLLYLNPAEAQLGAHSEDATTVKQRFVEAEIGQASATDVTTIPEANQSEISTSTLNETKLLSMTDESKSERLQEQDQGQEPSAQSSRSDVEPYDLITPDEVEESKETPVPDPYTHMTGLLGSTNFESGPVEAEPELWINAGRAFAVPIMINTPGTTLTWLFTTYPKDINFSLSYRESEWSAFEESEVLIPMCKCNSHKKAINGELTARKAGVYTLVFDNKTSRFTSKKLSYTLELRDLPAEDD